MAQLEEGSRQHRELSDSIDTVKAADDVRLPVLPQTPLAFLIQRLDVLASAGHEIQPEHELHFALKLSEDLFEVKKFAVWGNVITLKVADANHPTLADDFECVRWYLLKAMTAPEESELFSMLLECWSSAVMCNGFWKCLHNVAEGCVLWKKELSDMQKVFFASTADIAVGDFPLSLVDLLRCMQSAMRGIRGMCLPSRVWPA